MPVTALDPEFVYIGLVFALFVLPRVFERWRVPRAISAVGLGALVGMGLGVLTNDPTVKLLSTLGISTLFLFAGLEVRFDELRQERQVLAQHVAIQLVTQAVVTWLGQRWLGLDLRPAALLALALVTPSAGFILDSLRRSGLTSDQQFWVRSKTIATELVSLLVLFLVLQSSSVGRFVVGCLILSALIFALPAVFRLFAARIVPIAPRSEFAFLIMITIGTAYVTRQLGAYYLVGAFVVGIMAQRFRQQLPAMASEEMLHAVDVFASFFIPFYFFNAGLHLEAGQFTPQSAGLSLAFVVTMVPFRVGLTALHRAAALREPAGMGARVGLALAPTLVFSLVTAEILRDQFGVSPAIFGAVVIYALVTTVLPAVFLGTPAAEYDDPELPPLSADTDAPAVPSA